MGLFETGGPISREWKNSGRRWARGLGGLENGTIFMDVIFVSTLRCSTKVVSNVIHKLFKKGA